MIKRPASVPLFTVDPYFSIWSCSDKLYDTYTKHWTEKPWPIFAALYIDGQMHSLAGVDKDYVGLKSRIHQTNLKITPLSTAYTFENNIAKVKLTFTSPLLLDRLDILCRPVSYMAYDIEIKKESYEDAKFVFGISSQGCVNYHEQNVVFKKTPYSMCCGNSVQNPLSEVGDRVTIDWGYLHLCDKDAYISEPPGSYIGISDTSRTADTRRIVSRPMILNKEYNAHNDMPYLYVAKKEMSGVITLAYDEIKSVEYFYDELNEYFTKYFSSFEEMVNAAIKEYPQIKKLCDDFDEKLMSEAASLSKEYEYITSLAFRQAVAAHKICEDTEGNLLFLSKENDSNGCIGTLDITYPSIPLFLKYNPELIKGMLRPIIKYAKSDEWPHDFTPHDVGRYPIANGQVYKNNKIQFQMPVEEAGNMLISLAAIKKYSGDTELFDYNKELMHTWVSYLIKYGYDPEDQLCTDDFAGRLARNCNLSLKSIVALAAYSDLSGDKSYMDIAKKWAKNWEKDAKADHSGTRLTFDKPDTWSLKYNMVWDNLLGYKLFSDEVKKNEIKLYSEKMNEYGVPLDCRADYTKLDWLMWTTCLCDDKNYFEKVCKSICKMINETTDRVPMTDLYFTSNAECRTFINRSVVGGLFINLI